MDHMRQKTASASRAKTVDEYISRYPPKVQKALGDLRKTIRAAAPRAEETISYSMPAYKYHGWLVYFAAFKEHCSFFVASLALMKSMKKELELYGPKGATIHFSPDDPLPAPLVKKIVKLRMKENEEREEKKRRTAR